jgi:hypothetical protein
VRPAIAIPEPRSPDRGVALAWLALLLLLLQLPLIVNPGYLSFDELQWWARADVPGFSDIPWRAWSDWRTFQYRPLTFNLWLVLAHALAARAYAMHAVFVMIGTVNALLLAACVRTFGAERPTAAVAVVAFVLSPYVAYTHGWTGTLADLLVLLFGLLGTLALLAPERAPTRARTTAFVLMLLTLLALLAKESAIVLPPLWAIIASARGPRRLLLLTVPAALIVAGYLILRLPALWFTEASNAGYAWTLANVPGRVAEYALFPWLPPLFEVGPSLGRSLLRLALAGSCVGAVVLALLHTHWRLAAAWALTCTIALAPVLVLAHSFDQYAYLTSAAGIGVVACAWRRCGPDARGLLFAAGAIACVHGAQIMLRMREVGTIEQRFHAELVAAVANHAQPLRVDTARAADAWMLERWVGNVPSYRGTALAGRVTIGAAVPGAVALIMQPDGALTPATLPAQ